MNPHKLRQMVFAPAGDAQTGGESGSTGTISQAKQTITNTARDAAARIKSAAGDTASRAKAEAERLVAETKDDTAKRIDTYGSAIHESARSLEGQDPNIAWATHRVAEKIQGVADYIRTRDFNGLRVDAENLARRHPVAFFGGLLVAGLVIGNLLKARPQPETDSIEGSEFDDTTNTDWDSSAEIGKAGMGNASGSQTQFQSPGSTGI